MSDGKNIARLALARYHLQQAHDLFEKGSRGRSDLKPLLDELDKELPDVAELSKIGKTYEEAVRSYEYFQELQRICNPEERYETVTQPTMVVKLPVGSPYKEVKLTLPPQEEIYKRVMIRSQEIKDGKPYKGYGL